MAKVKGDYYDGWTVKFTKSESETIADAGNIAGAAAAFVPDPIVSKIVAAGLTVSAVLLRRAIRNGKCLKVKVRLHQMPSKWPPKGEELVRLLGRGPLSPSVEPSFYTP